ncbi:hypothetical protein B0H14DRAFT_2572480 [Mycena olivaceomarginata]|nr:hypothetical protein B0H14DRAFT_2572480 [Mycena olivaceomarginata]
MKCCHGLSLGAVVAVRFPSPAWPSALSHGVSVSLWQDSFCPAQLKLFVRILDGEDIFYSMATGDGKSALFVMPIKFQRHTASPVCPELFDNREEKHQELAIALRETQASRKVAAANKKRARVQDDDNAEEEETPAPKKRKNRIDGGQPKQTTVKPTAKAKAAAAAAAEESEEEAEESSSDDSGDDANVLQYTSDSTNYSD